MDASWLIQQEINPVAGGAASESNRFSIDLDSILFRVNQNGQTCLNAAVDGDPSLEHQFFDGASGIDAGIGENFLDSRFHVRGKVTWSQEASVSVVNFDFDRAAGKRTVSPFPKRTGGKSPFTSASPLSMIQITGSPASIASSDPFLDRI